MFKKKRNLLLIISLVSLAIAIGILLFIYINHKDFQDKDFREVIIIYGIIWSVFSFSFTVFFYGILNTVAEVRGTKMNMNFSVKGAGAFLVILLFVGFYFIFKMHQPASNIKKFKDEQKTNTETLIKSETDAPELIDNKKKQKVTETGEIGGKQPPNPPDDNDIVTPKKYVTTISGIIKYTNNTPVSGAQVCYRKDTALTDLKGHFEMQIEYEKNTSVIEITCYKDNKKLLLKPNNQIGVNSKEDLTFETEKY